ncbi:hypothetical protein DesfrDRAFT_2432 [Solidesulfovibrio fructosivorans JJ]]|uniref:Uncharacterized protein n=1 Tax=Solidesulfovibrio fructosivorans JJ] TaxID=596151 RepID=E1JXT3_SOLFR|nr:hypothetical protein DesfrDRAFT_2432 [Solidesulfovibrio fructosivorans JJ]]
MIPGNCCSHLDVPVLFLIFNRPETTARVFETIRQARPRQLFVAADGPRSHVPTDAETCRTAREIALAVDWDCEVKTLLRARNLGCRVAVSSSITWFFQQVDEGIILEDDVLPVAGFFDFCQSLLAHYRQDARVIQISGSNFQLGARRGEGSYYFSIFNHIWGWATWRRAWRLFDPSLRAVQRFQRSGVLERLFTNPATRDLWLESFTRAANGEIDTWDYAWTMAAFGSSGLTILPNANMVANIGFDLNATHTGSAGWLARLPVQDVEPLRHPSAVAADAAADTFTQTYFYDQRIANPALLCADVATLLEQARPGEAAALAHGFLSMYPEDTTLAWLEVLALANAGNTPQALAALRPFLARHPDHTGARSLLTGIRQALQGGTMKT